VNVLGTLIVYAKRTQIDGELNGNGGGYAGAAPNRNGLTGESPLDTNRGGRGGSGSYYKAGGGGGSHGENLSSLSSTCLNVS